MAYPAPQIKLTFGGSVYGDKDIWSCGLHIGGYPTGAPEWNPTTYGQFLQDAYVNIATWFARPTTQISSSALLEWVKVARIDEEGKYTNDAIIFDIVQPVAGGVSEVLAPQLTTVVTLDSGNKRGLARTGRFYPPLSGFIGSDGLIPQTVVKGMATSAATLINAIDQAALGIGPGMSVQIASKEGTGAFNDVVSVRVGRVVDTQRSRRNNFVEAYEYAPLD